MINTEPFSHCECRRMDNTHQLCQSDLMLQEEGKKVELVLRTGEEAKALVLDGCVFTDNATKCDAMYLFQGKGKKVIALVELKGAADIAHAFKQLAYTRHQRPEYQDLKQALHSSGPGITQEKAFVISNGTLSKPLREQLEREHNIRVSAILHSESTSKVPDIRAYF